MWAATSQDSILDGIEREREREMGKKRWHFPIFSVSWTTAMWTISVIHFHCYELSPLSNLPSHDDLKPLKFWAEVNLCPLYLFWPVFCHSNTKVKDATPTLFAYDGHHYCFPIHLLKVWWCHKSYQSLLNFESRHASITTGPCSYILKWKSL